MSAKRFINEFAFLSNFYPSPVKGPGDFIYPTVEHAYQASKSADHLDWVRIRDLETPGQAKAAGKKVKLRVDWDEARLEVMENLLSQKFKIGTELANRLVLVDGDIEEGNYWNDTFWGVCRGKGENHLGKLLMVLRDHIRSHTEVYKELDPALRDWEYDGYGTKVKKGTRTPHEDS